MSNRNQGQRPFTAHSATGAALADDAPNCSPYHAGLHSPDMAAPSAQVLQDRSKADGTTRQASALIGACRGFSFIGTAAEHLALTEKRIAEARKSHAPVKDLLKFRTKLKARAAALGA